MRVWILVAALEGLAGCFAASLSAAVPDSPADFTVLDVTVTTSPLRYGLNLQIPDLNNWTLDAGMEPTVLRLPGTATGGGSDFLLNESGPRTSWYDTIGDGFFDGAHVRVYREVGGQVQLVTTNTVAAYWASQTNGYRIDFVTSGPPVLAGDRYVVEMMATNAPAERVHSRMLPWMPRNDTWRPVGGANWPYGLPVEKYRDDTTQAPEEGGRSSMTFLTTGTHEVSLRQYYYGSPESTYPSLEPGRTYRVECWLRQVGVPSGQVTFRMSGSYSAVQHTWSGINSAWTKHSYDFVAPARPLPNTGTVENILAFTGPGQVWVDNLRVYEAGYPAFAPRPEALEELKRFRPGVLRIWSGQTNINFGTTLEDWLSSDAVSMVQWHPDHGRTSPENSWKLPLALEICRETGAAPWLIVGPYFREEEWLGLVEYLAGPAGTPYGDLRISHGQTQPWTELFPQIIFEFNNEGWNSIFTWQYPNGATNGRYADYFFKVARSSPWFGAMASKAQFMVNGWILQGGPTGYGHGAVQESSATATNVATYIGGWEAGVSAGGETFNTAGLQDFLLYPATNIRYYMNQHAATRRQLAAALGRTYGLAVYESGPGYPLPNPEHPFDPIAEAYGKSLAAGVATLDAFLDATLRGFDPQGFFTFRTGTSWSSHSTVAAGYHPHSSYLALELRNRWASGDAVATAIHAAPTVDVPAGENGVPPAPDTRLVETYAYRDGADWSVFVLSRRASGSTSVTMRLPFTAATTATLHRLSGDPGTSNTYTRTLSIESLPAQVDLPAANFVLPASSVYLFRFEGTTAPPAPLGPRAWISRAIGQDDPTTSPVVRFGVTFSEPVTGLTLQDFAIGGTAGAVDGALEELEPFTRTSYQVSLSGMTSSGTVTLALPAGAALSDSGAGSLVAEAIDASIDFAPQPPRDVVLVHEPFAVGPGETPVPPFAQGVATGFGWAGAWQLQNFSAATYGNGYRIAEAPALAWQSLDTTGSHLVGGRAYETAGRAIDVAGALADFRSGTSLPALAGRSGTTLYLSALLRKENANDEPLFLSLNRSSASWVTQENRVAVGYFGTSSNNGGQRYWSVMLRNAADTGFDVVRTNVPVVPGQTAFLVLRLQFGSSDQLELYVNPTSLSGAAPAVPDATVTSSPTAPDILFRTVGFYGGNSLSQGAVDEIRLADSFAAATPTPVIPVTVSLFQIE